MRCDTEIMVSRLPNDMIGGIMDYDLRARRMSEKCRKDDNLTPEQRAALKILSKVASICICKADKGPELVILNSADYIQAGYGLLRSEQFNTLDHDPTEKRGKEMNKILLELKKAAKITEETYRRCRSNNATTANMYLLSKIHKPKLQIRTVLAAYLSFNHSLAKMLNTCIRGCRPLNEHGVLNGPILAEEVRNLPSNTSWFITADIKSLFTNNPLQETIELTAIILEKNCGVPKLDLITWSKLLTLCTKKSAFKFNDSIFEQVDGVAEGYKKRYKRINTLVEIC
ncbi:hypothetical protein ACOME3_005322 [Neoechinorhynchus agilis]